MRIISQDRKFDYPYDKIAIYVEENFVMADLLNGCVDRVIAEYSSEENAMEAVYIMRAIYALQKVQRKHMLDDKSIEKLKEHCIFASAPDMGIYSEDFAFVFPKEKDLEGKK